MTIGELKEEILGKWEGAPAAALSVCIIEYLASLPAEELKFLTFRSLAKATPSKMVVTAELAAAVNILTGSLSLLDVHGLLIDEYEREYDLDDDEFAAARTTNSVVHPETGQIITNAAAHIVPYFVPTDRFYRAIK